ncbi:MULTISPECIES: hypothetical protein [Methanococcoides]|uniref:Uncharacterized protein n=1 Tax=Methanococcoides seepicolus TaxID=2828780 RepID=A0A9E4ZGJ4_9EURY|nr:hypothetical protein [Methanococcoides sp.]MCM1986783.1 hypothetical protein [Methanococcoides seepicolus]
MYPLKTEKKEYNVAKQEYYAITKRNKKIAMADMLILGTGLLLKYFDQAEIGKHFMWLGFVLLIYIFGTNMMARNDLRKQQP